MLAGLLSVTSQAQNLLGITTSPYGGTHRIYLNPALAADSPHSYDANLFTANVHADNNYVRYNAPYSLLTLLAQNVPNRFRRPDGSLAFQMDYTREILDGKSKYGTLWGEVRGPALQFKTGPRGGLGFTSRLRAAAQVSGASEQLLSALRASLRDSALFSIPSRDNKFSINTNTYAEVALTFAYTLLEDEGQKLLGGITVKRLFGYTSGHLINRGLDYQIQFDQTGRDEGYLEVNQVDADLGYTSFLQGRNFSPRTLLNPEAPGNGWGVDLGVSYIAQVDEDAPLLRLSGSLMDIGSIRYEGQAYDVQRQNVRFYPSDFDQVGGSEDIAGVLRQKLDIEPASGKRSFRSGLPTALNLAAEWQSPAGLGMSVVWFQNMRGLTAIAMHQPTLIAITPRFTTRLIEASIPIAYLNRGIMVGLAGRLGPFWLGSDNIMGLMGSGRNGFAPRGIDVYGGVAFGLNRKTL
ncbi:hypothetical protein GCM10023189_05260 [Nibrella saemangeumensis]|uniref:DUF5723 domain-containing protein n=1 Tax=Nibrella saemangeumensis TaxID=1084526 RepID=A0ABP8MBS8_9BACT